MTKLFITLYLVVLASFGLFIGFIITINVLEGILPDSKNIEERIAKGSFILLDKSIEGLTQEQTQQIVEQHKKAFNSFFGLFELSQLPLDKDEIKRLKEGEMVFSEEENDAIKDEYIKTHKYEKINPTLFYKKVPDSTWVWRLDFDTEISQGIHNVTINTTVEPGKFINGMHYLIHSLLLKEKQEKWPKILKDLQPDYAFSLSLHETSEFLTALENQNDLQSRIRKGDVVNITQGTDYVTFVQRIPNSTKTLQFGPFKIPWIMLYGIHLALLGFVLSIATALFLWVRPFWANLIKIKQAANEFGSGNYNARIPYKKHAQIAEIAQAFNAMAERTQRSIRSHKELTSAVSHELRTPVARMRFALEMLSASEDKNDKQRFVKDINKDIDELDLLLEELLTYARFDQNNAAIKLNKERLIPWINRSMEKLTPLTKDKILNYQVEGIGVNEAVWMDARLMSRVLDNLVGNALRYAHQHIEVTLTKDTDDYLLVVEDDGVGVPKIERKHIFDAFSRLDASRDRASGGFGLGLAIAARIVKEHEGSISINHSILGGARFEVRFPAFPKESLS